MLKQWKGFVAGATITAMLSCGMVAFSESITKSISVMYDNIKILIDGVEYAAKDANGNVVEPFIYNGTTYLPVRGIANAFGKDVSWEPQTSTVKLGSVNYDWLDQMGYANYETSGNENKIGAWISGKASTTGTKYERGITFILGYGLNCGAKKDNNDNIVSYQTVEYLINSRYKNFTGTICCTDIDDSYYERNNQNSIIKIYGDGNLLYTSPPLTKGAKPFELNLEISNYKILKINASIPNLINDGSIKSAIGIAEARLAKK